MSGRPELIRVHCNEADVDREFDTWADPLAWLPMLGPSVTVIGMRLIAVMGQRVNVHGLALECGLQSSTFWKATERAISFGVASMPAPDVLVWHRFTYDPSDRVARFIERRLDRVPS